MGKSAKIRHRRLRRVRKRRELAESLLERVKASFKTMGEGATLSTKAGREKLVRHCRSRLRAQYGPSADVHLEGNTLISTIPEVVNRPADYIRFTFKG